MDLDYSLHLEPTHLLYYWLHLESTHLGSARDNAAEGLALAATRSEKAVGSGVVGPAGEEAVELVPRRRGEEEEEEEGGGERKGGVRG
jgi:hypothetical protein